MSEHKAIATLGDGRVNTELNKSVGERIRAQRALLGLTQQNVADRIGTTRWTVAKIENGVQGIKLKVLVSLATALETTPEHLSGWGEPDERENQLGINQEDSK